MKNTITEEEELYKENIIDHYKHPHNKEAIPDCQLTHREYNPLCGDDITIYIEIENEKVKRATFQGHGCAISQASISMLTDKIKGMEVKKAKELTREEILDMLGIPIGPVRMKCALLSLKVLIKGIENNA